VINYFNYFTEIEEHFQRARGTSLFLLSPLDWALIETWKNSGIPLEAVLRGIDASFEKYHARKQKTQRVNSLAFCAQAVLTEAQLSAEGATVPPPESAPFPENDVRGYLLANAAELRKQEGAEFESVAAKLDQLARENCKDLEALEQQLSVLEQRVIAIARSRQSDEAALETKRELEAQLRPYRGKMSAPQLAMLEQQYFERKILESGRLPRLSLFYLR
jgi:hypothetical protein